MMRLMLRLAAIVLVLAPAACQSTDSLPSQSEQQAILIATKCVAPFMSDWPDYEVRARLQDEGAWVVSFVRYPVAGPDGKRIVVVNRNGGIDQMK